MATPRPMRLTTFSVYWAMSRWCESASTAATPASTASPPTTMGRSAATSVRNTERRTSSASGKEMSSARSRSCSSWVFRSTRNAGFPVTATSKGPSRSAAFTAGNAPTAAFSSPLRRTSTSAVLPSLRDEAAPGLLRRGDHRDHALHLGAGADLLQQQGHRRLEHRIGRRHRRVGEQGDHAGVGVGPGGAPDERGGLGGLGALDGPAGQAPAADQREHRQRQHHEGAGEDHQAVPGDGPGQGDEHEGGSCPIPARQATGRRGMHRGLPRSSRLD